MEEVVEAAILSLRDPIGSQPDDIADWISVRSRTQPRTPHPLRRKGVMVRA